jgi:hypothetical protein
MLTRYKIIAESDNINSNLRNINNKIIFRNLKEININFMAKLEEEIILEEFFICQY